MIDQVRTGKHFNVAITDTSLAVTRKQDQIDAEAAWTVLRAAHPGPRRRTRRARRGHAYKNLKYVEGTSGTSNPTTWTCGRLHGSRNVSRPTC